MTELVLSRSQINGKPVRFNTNRKFLEQALALGFNELQIVDANTPCLCEDERRSYFWMGLGAEYAIRPSKKCIRIDSASAMPTDTGCQERRPALPPIPSPPDSPNSSHERSPQMTRSAIKNGSPNSEQHHTDHSEQNGLTNGRSSESTTESATSPLHGSTSSNGTLASASQPEGTSSETGIVDPIAAAEALQTDLRTALASTSRLLQALRRNRKQARLVENTLQSLRQLQGV